MKMINVAIFGTGWAAKTHFETIKKIKNLKVCSVFGRNAQRLKKISKDWKVNTYTDKSEMFINEKIDAVLIANQNFYHYQDAMFVLKMGIDIIMEKPISTNFEKSKKIMNFAKKKKLKILIVMQRRFDASTEFFKKMIKKKIGRIIFIKLNIFMFRDSNYFHKMKWINKKNNGGGVLIHHAIHTIDQLIYILDKKVIKAIGFLSNEFRKLKIEDTVSGLIFFDNKKVTSLNATYCANSNLKNSIEIHGEKMSVKLENNMIYNISKKYDEKGYVLKSFSKKSLGSYENIWREFLKKNKSKVLINKVMEAHKVVSLLYKPTLIEKKL
jgi:UDP-N-acetyl-2-amino-2-deoxyglucuronate dehydrogenase